jgi:hypothetical protein
MKLVSQHYKLGAMLTSLGVTEALCSSLCTEIGELWSRLERTESGEQMQPGSMQ